MELLIKKTYEELEQPQVFYTKDALKMFAKFSGKYLC